MNRATERGYESRVSGSIELRATSGKALVVRGYAAVFGKRSEDLGGFVEYIDPGAFDAVLYDDCRCLFNHDSNLLLGRTRSGTCRIWQDSVGLGYECTLGDTSIARDLVTHLRRRDVTQSSFAFRVAKGGDRWIQQGDRITRYIKRLERLFDVSAVTFPAYPDATVALAERARRFGQPPSQSYRPSIDLMKRRLELAEREC